MTGLLWALALLVLIEVGWLAGVLWAHTRARGARTRRLRAEQLRRGTLLLGCTLAVIGIVFLVT